jgi:hypothetical protein
MANGHIDDVMAKLLYFHLMDNNVKQKCDDSFAYAGYSGVAAPVQTVGQVRDA